MHRTGIINQEIVENKCSIEKTQRTCDFCTRYIVPRIQGSQMCEPVYQLFLVNTKRNSKFLGFT